jgi:hypothetical protein
MILLKEFVYICHKKITQTKMKEKTPQNLRKAGRPRLEPTSVISVRLPTRLKVEVEERFGKHWQQLFKSFVAVYLLHEEENK